MLLDVNPAVAEFYDSSISNMFDNVVGIERYIIAYLYT